jgi:hypothetical protein
VIFEALAAHTLHKVLFRLTKIPGDREIDSVFVFRGTEKS